jgi:alkaline phosphatase D
MRAYFEWLPIRPVSDEDDADLSEPTEIYRQFLWGDLVDLLMLDTRHIARDEPHTLTQYASAEGYDFAGVLTDAMEESRELLGTNQMSWLEEKMLTSTATWQLLGQQILMGRMYLPGAVATQQMSIPDYAELGAIAVLAARAQAADPTLTTAELSYLADNQDRLTVEVMALLQAPALPYNLDAWDGYDSERERLYTIAKAAEANLVVVAGDTHNVWSNHLTDNNGNAVGVELATASVSSPGLEYYLGVPEEEYAATEGGLVSIIDDLQYLNMADRGLLTINFTHQELVAT